MLTKADTGMITIVNHVLTFPGWRRILSEQLHYVVRFGLEWDVWRCNVAGSPRSVADVEALAAEHGIRLDQVVRNHPNCYEIPALEIASQTHRGKVLYFHTKGVTMPEDPGRQKHRWLMQHFVLRQWRDCVRDLDDHDVAGVYWRSDLPQIPHFTGNFWWANAEFLRGLPDIREYPKQFRLADHLRIHHPRCAAEFWLGSGPVRPRVKSYYCEGVPLVVMADLPDIYACPREIFEQLDGLDPSMPALSLSANADSPLSRFANSRSRLKRRIRGAIPRVLAESIQRRRTAFLDWWHLLRRRS
jgi:hypothetical protein